MTLIIISAYIAIAVMLFCAMLISDGFKDCKGWFDSVFWLVCLFIFSALWGVVLPISFARFLVNKKV